VTKQLLDGAGLKLGLFSANCSSGMAVTTIEDRWAATWEENLQLAKLADESGIDFMLPIARWIGYGGTTNFHESVLDPVALAAALLAHTERLVVFATIHTAFNHPVVAAKAMATVDQAGRGRAGLNIVAGWNKPEYDAMGIDLPQDHDARYAMAQEWWGDRPAAMVRAGPLRHRRPLLATAGGGVEPQALRRSAPYPQRRLLAPGSGLRRPQLRRGVHRRGRPRGRSRGGRDGDRGGPRYLRPPGGGVHSVLQRLSSDACRGARVPSLVCGGTRRLGRRGQSDDASGLARAVVHAGDARDVPWSLRGRARSVPADRHPRRRRRRDPAFCAVSWPAS
jgi:Luciferase-like monooxygenase